MSRADIKLLEFLAWVEDNFSNIGDDEYIGVHDGDHYTREQIVEQFKTTMD